MTLDLDAVWLRLQAMAQGLLTALPGVLVGLLVFLLFLFLSRFVRGGVSSLAGRAGQPPGIALVFSRVASGLFLTLGILVALTIAVPSLNAGTLFSALGVSGVAIGFAFKDIFQNLLAGLLILLTRPFRIGDQIVSGDHEGTVEDIQVRATLLRTYDNRQVVIPNSELYTNRVVVNTAYDKRRLSVLVGIGFGDDINQAKAVILETLEAVPGVLADPAPEVLIRELGDFSVNLDVRFWIDPPVRRETVQVQDQVIGAITPALLGVGIDLPFPTQQVLWHDQTEATDGNRTRQREGWPARKNNPPSRQQQAQVALETAAPPSGSGLRQEQEQ